jgi:hypothetical protein
MQAARAIAVSLWDVELPAEHGKVVSVCCTEVRLFRTRVLLSVVSDSVAVAAQVHAREPKNRVT